MNFKCNDLISFSLRTTTKNDTEQQENTIGNSCSIFVHWTFVFSVFSVVNVSPKRVHFLQYIGKRIEFHYDLSCAMRLFQMNWTRMVFCFSRLFHLFHIVCAFSSHNGLNDWKNLPLENEIIRTGWTWSIRIWLIGTIRIVQHRLFYFLFIDFPVNLELSSVQIPFFFWGDFNDVANKDDETFLHFSLASMTLGFLSFHMKITVTWLTIRK